jgi:hypothetical protein
MTSHRRRILGAGFALVLGLAITLTVVRNAHGAPASDVHYRIAGFAELTNGESATLSIANVSTSTCQADLVLVNTSNRVVKEVKNLSIAPQMGTLMTYDDVTKGRMRLRPTVIALGDSCPAFHATLEVFGTSSKVTTQALQFADPTG